MTNLRSSSQQAKLASTQNSGFPRRAVFVSNLQTCAASSENACHYDGRASGGFVGGINTYTYVNGNPISRADPLGLWSTDAHNEIIFSYGSQLGISLESINAMMQGSKSADDSQYQGNEFSYMHAMSSSNYSKAQACKATNDFVSAQLAAATKLINSNRNSTAAYFQLGFGLHPIMDSTSPAHSDFQYWDMFSLEALTHGNIPFFSKENTDSLTPGLKNLSVSQMIAATQGKKLDCSCY